MPASPSGTTVSVDVMFLLHRSIIDLFRLEKETLENLLDHAAQHRAPVFVNESQQQALLVVDLERLVVPVVVVFGVSTLKILRV